MYTNAINKDQQIFLAFEIFSPWNIFFGEINQRNIENQCSVNTRKIQYLYSEAYIVKEATREMTVPSLQKNWNITPSQVSTNRWTF